MRIRQLRKARIDERHPRGMTQVELSELSGVTQSTISQLENNGKNATVEVLSKIAAALNVEVADLFERSVADELAAEIAGRINRFSEADRQQVLDYLAFLESRLAQDD